MDKEQQKKLLIEIMEADEKDGLYKQQTAVEWLTIRYHHRHGHLSLEDIKQAKQMEKDQLNKACYDGYYREDLYDTRNYYKDTYCEYSGLPSVESYQNK